MNHITFVTGGCRSGKSRYAMELALQKSPRAFVATATAFDKEMEQRIAAHQAERGDTFELLEAPTDIAGAIRSIQPAAGVALIDCLTVWLGNLMHKHGDDQDAFPEVDDFLSLLEGPPVDLVIVSNEVGLGIVPENALARRYRDLAGKINQEVAKRADAVAFVVSGIPMILKGTPNGRA